MNGPRSVRFIVDALFIIERRFTRYSRGSRVGDSHEKRGLSFFFFFILDKRSPKWFCMGYFDYLRTSHVHYRLLPLNFCLRPPTIFTYTQYLNYEKKSPGRRAIRLAPSPAHCAVGSHGAVRIDIAYKPRLFQKLFIDLFARYSVFYDVLSTRFSRRTSLQRPRVRTRVHVYSALYNIVI